MSYTALYNTDLLPLLISLLFLSIIVLWIAVRNYKNFLVTFLIIPLTLVSATTSYFTVDRLLGYPVQIQIPDDSLYVMHIESQDKQRIYVWVIPPESTKPRAFSIVNSDQNKQAMQDAQQKSERGVPQQVGTEEGNMGETQGGEYETYDFQMPNIPGAVKSE
jgi:hypothetical protein